MIPVSLRRLNAETRTVLTISSIATVSMNDQHRERHVRHAVEQAEQVLQDLPLVLHRLDARPALEGAGDHLVLVGSFSLTR